MIRQWFFRKQCVQHEGLYVAVQYIIHQKQISRNKVAKKGLMPKKTNTVTLKASQKD